MSARPNHKTKAGASKGKKRIVARGQFAGTKNPRHLRVINALMKRAGVSREEVDTVAGCSNGPDLISKLRDLGLSIPCENVPFYDRDGHEVKRGVYYLTPEDRQKIEAWLKRTSSKNARAAAKKAAAAQYKFDFDTDVTFLVILAGLLLASLGGGGHVA